MEAVKHTPGPWFASGRYIGTVNHMSYIGECRNAADNWSDDCPASANARLIAAAPELLEALKEAQLALAMCQPRTDNGAKCQREAMENARDAIAKATGAA